MISTLRVSLDSQRSLTSFSSSGMTSIVLHPAHCIKIRFKLLKAESKNINVFWKGVNIGFWNKQASYGVIKDSISVKLLNYISSYCFPSNNHNQIYHQNLLIDWIKMKNLFNMIVKRINNIPRTFLLRSISP